MKRAVNMRVCLVFFVCTVLVASAIARPGSRVNRQERNHRTFEDGIDARKSNDESDPTFLDDFFNGRPIPQDSDRFGKVRNVDKSLELDEQVQSESNESDESRSGEHDSYYADNYSEEEYEDGQSEEDDEDRRVIETSKYDDNDLDNEIFRTENDDRRPPPPFYGSKAQEPRRYDDDDIDIDTDVFRAENDDRRPPPPFYGSKAQEPRRYDDNDIDVFRAQNNNRRPSTPFHFPKAQEPRRYDDDDIDNDIDNDVSEMDSIDERPPPPFYGPRGVVEPRKHDDSFLEDRSFDEVAGEKNHGPPTQHQESQKSLSDYCDTYCSGRKIRHRGAVGARIRSICRCDDQMQDKK